MRIPFTRYGLPQLLIYPLVVLAIMVILFFVFRRSWILFPIEIILLLVFFWMMSFFRDPSRTVNYDEKVLLSPADGTITDISTVNDSELGPGALRIGMFLSVFNVHINRVPCDVRIEKVTYKKGKFINAMSADAAKINESNGVLMVRLNEPKEKLLVRQVSGAIARHIVCEAKESTEYRQGEQFGMIKFGSRTELYLPAALEGKYKIEVKIGDKMRAGLSPMVRFIE